MNKMLFVENVNIENPIDYCKDIVIKNRLKYYVYGYMSCSNYYYLKEIHSMFDLKFNRRIKAAEVILLRSKYIN